MIVKVGTNSFGHIDRLAFRRIQNTGGVKTARINDLTDSAMLIHLLRYDTTQGCFGGDIVVKDGGFEVNGQFAKVSAEHDLEQIDWVNDGVGIVFKATGFFTTKAAAEKHLREGGAKKAVTTAPSGSDVKTIVFNINREVPDGIETVISTGSRAANCLVPMANALSESFDFKVGATTTVHGYTGDQTTLDTLHRKGDFRHTRVATGNIVLNSTGAAKTTGLIIPELNDKLQGHTQRVPVPTGSLTELASVLDRRVTAEEVDATIQAAATESFGYNTDLIVSCNIVGISSGSLFDTTQTEATEVVDGIQLVKTASWYDSEIFHTSQFVRALRYSAKVAK